MDAEGARTFLPRMLKVAELRAQGKRPDEIKGIIADAVAKGDLQPPRRSGVDYMLSTEKGTPYALIIVPVGVHEGPGHSSAGAQ